MFLQVTNSTALDLT